ncbi:MAG: glycosyltransferase involved in cell wall biosynthesis, partial [Pseudohongiellaceae bacterium]
CRLLFAPIAPFFLFDLKKMIKQFDPDIIHVHMPNLSAFWLLLVGRQLAKPVIVHWHADVIASRQNILLSFAYWFYRPLEQLLLKRADAVIVTSANYLKSSVPLRKWQGKCHIIPLGLDTLKVGSRGQINDTSERQLWKVESRLKVLCVGRLTYYKGQEFLIKAVSGLDNVELILVGQGKKLASFRKLINRLGCEDNVKIFGHAETQELAALMNSCDCLCLPSIERTEAFGLVLLEAMQDAKPCICTDVEGSGMSWVVQHEKTGLVVNAADSSALRDGILKLANNRELARQYGEAGHDRFRNEFSLDKVAGEIVSLYNRVVQSHLNN